MNQQQAISSDLIRGHIDTIILHTLLDGDKYAQQISESVEIKSEKKYVLNQATLYSSLKRLENLKFVSSYWFDASDGRRKYFKITENGKQEVDKNLSSWAFSRQIIDKLVDYTPEPQKKQSPVAVFPVYSKAEENVKQVISDKPVSDAAVTSVQPKNVMSENKDAKDASVYESEKNCKTVVENDEKEINFRNILNGLIKSSVINSEENDKRIIDKIDEEEAEKPKFNETLSVSDYNAEQVNNNGKIDFGDLTLAAAKEGYKIRISSKNSAKPVGSLYFNKLRLFTSVFLLFLVIIQTFLYKNYAFKDVSIVGYAIAIIACGAVVSCVFAVNYFKNPIKTVSKKLNGNRILTAAIIAFNLLLVTFALTFLFETDFDVKTNIIAFILVPVTLILDFVLYFVMEFLFSKFPVFRVKRQ